MTASITYSMAFLVGLMSSVHCIGMCGGIVNALNFARPKHPNRLSNTLTTHLFYNIGRISTYAIAGAAVGGLSTWLQSGSSFIGPVLRGLAGLMLIAMGMYVGGWWQGLGQLEKLGNHLWRFVQPLATRLLPVTSPGKALLLGAAWGWLPCALVYSNLSLAATAPHWQQSMLIMLSFAAGTLPSMLLTGVFSQQLKLWLQKNRVRSWAALIVIAFGLSTIIWPIYHQFGHQHEGHNHNTDTMMHSTE